MKYSTNPEENEKEMQKLKKYLICSQVFLVSVHQQSPFIRDC